MKIAVFSDTHDNIWKLELALGLMKNADVLIHCGDLCSPFVMKRLGEASKDRPVHVVWGNNEGDIRLICQIAEKYSKARFEKNFAEAFAKALRSAK